jgi:hypothetical protein
MISLTGEPCDYCRPNGYFNNATGTTVCYACQPGKYLNGPNWYCFDCWSNLINTDYGQSTCYSCGTGLVPDDYHTSCITCPYGKIQKSDYSGCQGCNAGTQFTNSSSGVTSCTSCSLGYYSPMIGSNCILCPPGNVTEAVTSGATSCTQCAIGTYNAWYGNNGCPACATAQQPGMTYCPAASCSDGIKDGDETGTFLLTTSLAHVHYLFSFVVFDCVCLV